MVPINVDPSANVADVPTAQYTLSGKPPLDMIMFVPPDVITVVPERKTQTPVLLLGPYPARVSVPVLNVKTLVPPPAELYTPGGSVSPDSSELMVVAEEAWIVKAV